MEWEWRVQKAGIGERKGEGVEWVEGVVEGFMGAEMGAAVRSCEVEVELCVVGFS